MILIGEGKQHAENLPDAIYYHENRIAICKTVFQETGYGIRFTPVILETIKKTHKTLPYILRNQYKFSSEIFHSLVEIPKEVILQGKESNYCFDIFQRIQSCHFINEFFTDVYENIIYPVFKRFGYYSPTMAHVLFIGFLCEMGEFYCSTYYNLTWKHFMRDNYPRHKIIKTLTNMPQYYKNMINDEMNTWTRAINV